jgi:hypothetical protein
MTGHRAQIAACRRRGRSQPRETFHLFEAMTRERCGHPDMLRRSVEAAAFSSLVVQVRRLQAIRTTRGLGGEGGGSTGERGASGWATLAALVPPAWICLAAPRTREGAVENFAAVRLGASGWGARWGRRMAFG